MMLVRLQVGSRADAATYARRQQPAVGIMMVVEMQHAPVDDALVVHVRQCLCQCPHDVARLPFAVRGARDDAVKQLAACKCRPDMGGGDDDDDDRCGECGGTVMRTPPATGSASSTSCSPVMSSVTM